MASNSSTLIPSRGLSYTRIWPTSSRHRPRARGWGQPSTHSLRSRCTSSRSRPMSIRTLNRHPLPMPAPQACVCIGRQTLHRSLRQVRELRLCMRSMRGMFRAVLWLDLWGQVAAGSCGHRPVYPRQRDGRSSRSRSLNLSNNPRHSLSGPMNRLRMVVNCRLCRLRCSTVRSSSSTLRHRPSSRTLRRMRTSSSTMCRRLSSRTGRRHGRPRAPNRLGLIRTSKCTAGWPRPKLNGHVWSYSPSSSSILPSRRLCRHHHRIKTFHSCHIAARSHHHPYIPQAIPFSYLCAPGLFTSIRLSQFRSHTLFR